MMEWSEMLPELLDIIAQKYITFYEDYPSFACVCKSWRLAATRTHHNSNGPPSRFPSLMLADKSDDRGEPRELSLLSNKSIIRKIRLPEAYGKACKSSCGWILTVGKDFASKLINPLSREIINLPDVNTFPEFIHPLNWCIAIQKVVPETYKTKNFQVLAYDLETGNWSKVKDFGRKTLFVGFSSSFWTEDTVIKDNCIYYTDDEISEYEDSEKGGGRDMGIYHLSDGTMEPPHFTGESRSHFTPPIWLQSM